MRIRKSPSIRYVLTSLLALALSACGGGSGTGDTAVSPPAAGNPPPPQTEVLADDATDHAFLTDHFSGSQNCSLCHNGLQDANGHDVSIVADWQATMMAEGSRDPLWRVKVASEIKRLGLREEIESSCARCQKD